MPESSFRLLTDPEIASFSCRTPVIEGVLRYWNGLRASGAIPDRCQLEPIDLKPFLAHILMVDIATAPFRARYRLVGTEIVRFARFDYTNRFVDELRFQDDVGTDWSDCYRQVVEARRPGFGISHWAVDDGSLRWIEFVICPLLTSEHQIGQCLAAEDYERLNVIEIDSIRSVIPLS